LINRQSGQWQGKAFIGGGRKPLRDALYMPALVALRYNPDLKAKYEDLRAAGKPAKVAIVAVMRKLIETANALVRADRLWVGKTAWSRRILLSSVSTWQNVFSSCTARAVTVRLHIAKSCHGGRCSHSWHSSPSASSPWRPVQRHMAGVGHDVRLIPPVYVKSFVKRQKNDMADAEAIVEAALRPPR